MDENEKNDPKATKKNRPWAAFLKWPALVCLGICNPRMTANETTPRRLFEASAGLPRGRLFFRQPGDDDEKKRPQGDSKKNGHGLPFKMADPDLPGDRQPGMTAKLI